MRGSDRGGCSGRSDTGMVIARKATWCTVHRMESSSVQLAPSQIHSLCPVKREHVQELYASNPGVTILRLHATLHAVYISSRVSRPEIIRSMIEAW
ncbi:hypothetical protein SCLCIDRAFT_156611 [Scleroderma citrinum Foug A]|uniref:Uncharacterized protein n=1 Tax=Scleroderma citrinum Foug A TaxID=1036808 RepID=A0A0C3AA52_9AGAM|nr:hypothetical protein SCLCIDRAFT_156611 [Scleroderma citrinum Foug A]